MAARWSTNQLGNRSPHSRGVWPFEPGACTAMISQRAQSVLCIVVALLMLQVGMFTCAATRIQLRRPSTQRIKLSFTDDSVLVYALSGVALWTGI